ncbi:MAG TPA: BppU family phage baseplate upper protein, partial [Negativicutes bacterium]|nr:BppU family phage baseplate upper protein [Negativicutes bacterium]
MPIKTFDIDLDIKNPEYKLVPYVEVVSGDTDTNQLNINLFEDFTPVNASGNTAVICFAKPDGTTVFQNLAIVDDTKAQYTCVLSTQTIVVPGRVRAEVSLYEGTKRITSTRFEFVVRKALLDEGTPESSNEFSALTEALATVTQYDNRIAAVENEVQASAPIGTLELTISNPVSSINAKVNGGLNFEMTAKPLVVNLLGSAGDCEDVSNYSAVGGTIALDTTLKVYGGNSIKLTTTLGTGTSRIEGALKAIDVTKYYLASAYIYSTNANIKYLAVRNNVPSTVKSAIKQTTTTNAWERFGVALSPTDLSGSSSIKLATMQVISSIGETINADGFMLNEISADDYNNLTVDQLLAKYPYVNGIQPMMGLDVKACGKNLFDTEKSWRNAGSNTTIKNGTAYTITKTSSNGYI